MKTRYWALPLVFMCVSASVWGVYGTSFASAPASVQSGVEYMVGCETYKDYEVTYGLILYKDGTYYSESVDDGGDFSRLYMTEYQTDYGNRTIQYDLYAYDEWSNETATTSVAVSLPNQSPVGSFDSISASVANGQSVIASGWAADYELGAPVSHVDYYIDGTYVGQASLGGSRPDVQAAKSAWGDVWLYCTCDLTNSGWSLSYNTGSLSVGQHSMRIVAYDDQNLSTELGTKTFTVTANQSTGSSSLSDYQLGIDPNNRTTAGQTLDWMVSGLNSGAYGSVVATTSITLEYSQQSSGSVRLFVTQPSL